MKGDKILIENKCKELGFELLDENFDYDKSRDKTFLVRCLKCGKISSKSFVTLVKGNHQCRYCRDVSRDYKNSLTEVMPKILSTCDECNYTFIGFENNEWKKCRDSKLILKCNNCGRITHKNYDNFVNKKCKCICYRHQRTHDVNVLDDKEVMNKINNSCNKHNFTFVQFLSIDEKYHNNKTILELKCNKCGEKVTYTFNHFTNRKNISCKHCNKSSLENQLKQKLIDENVFFEEQKKFEWLERLSLDFYIPEYKIAIECQGIQHFEPIDFFGGENAFIKQVERDKKKLRLCAENNVKLKYIVDSKEIDNIKDILS